MRSHGGGGEANQEGDHERNQRPSITQRQDEKTSMCACRSRVCSTYKPTCFLHRTPIDSICSCSAVQPCCPRIYQEQSQIIRHTITQPVVQGSRSKVSSLTRFIFPKTRTIVFPPSSFTRSRTPSQFPTSIRFRSPPKINNTSAPCLLACLLVPPPRRKVCRSVLESNVLILT